MKHILLFLVVLGISFQLYAQEKTTETSLLKLVKINHSKELENRLSMLKEIKQMESPDKTIDSVTLASEVYAKIKGVYQDVFTTNDLDKLHTFYNSPLGKKLLKNQDELNTKVSTIITNWEMEQLGINTEEELIEPPMLVDEELVDANGTFLENAPPPETKEKKLPEIKTLDALKTLLRKNMYMVDQDLLVTILGQEEVDNLFKAEFTLQEAEIEEKAPVKE